MDMILNLLKALATIVSTVKTLFEFTTGGRRDSAITDDEGR